MSYRQHMHDLAAAVGQLIAGRAPVPTDDLDLALGAFG